MTTKHPTTPPAAIDRVMTAFEGFMHRLMAAHAPEVNALDITMPQAKALYIVEAAGELRMSELAARMGVSSSTATGHVDRLVELRLLERRDDPSDRRQVVVETTPEAQAHLDQLRELNASRMRQLLTHLNGDDLDAVERAITVLGAAIDAADAPDRTTTKTTSDRGTHR